MVIVELIVSFFLVVGVFFAAVGVLGMVKFPDFFSRAQAFTCIGTMGIIGTGVGSLIYYAANGMPAVWYVKTVMIIALIMFTSAISGHSLDKGAYKSGLRPKGGFVKDDYEDNGYNDYVDLENKEAK